MIDRSFIKPIRNSFDFREQPIRIINSGIVKYAAESTNDYLKHIKSEPGRTKILALFLGAGEYYSSNKNGDWFSEKDLIKRHPTFKSCGHVYEHHINKDPKKKLGDVEFVTYNYKMRRVEGVMSLINSLCSKYVEKVDRGEDLPVSMAARLKNDICSICHHKSRSFNEYCYHLREEMNKIHEDGSKTYAINPDPIFFDISMVYRPADETAYSLKKVASILGTEYNPDFVVRMAEAKSLKGVEKTAVLKKLSELEKHIEGVLAGKVENGTLINTLKRMANTKDMPDSTIDKFKAMPLEKAFGSLMDKDILLTLKEFLKMIGEEGIFKEVESLLPTGFRDTEEAGPCDLDYQKGDAFSDHVIEGIPEGRQLGKANKSIIIKFESPPVKRITSSADGTSRSMRSSKGMIIIKKSNSLVAKRAANIYNSYKLDFFMKNPSPLAGLNVLSNNFFRT
jgi:hypothetical protein